MTWIYNDDLYNPKISDKNYINNSKEWATVSTVGLLDSFEIYLSYGKQEWEHILGLSPELEEPANYLTYELHDEKQGKFIFDVHLHVFSYITKIWISNVKNKFEINSWKYLFIAVYSPIGEVHLLQDGLITLSGITNCLTADRVVIQNNKDLSDISVWLKFPLTYSCKLKKPPIPHSLNHVTLSHFSNSCQRPHISLN